MQQQKDWEAVWEGREKLRLEQEHKEEDLRRILAKQRKWVFMQILGSMWKFYCLFFNWNASVVQKAIGGY